MSPECMRALYAWLEAESFGADAGGARQLRVASMAFEAGWNARSALVRQRAPYRPEVQCVPSFVVLCRRCGAAEGACACSRKER
jgi:hypothetical protein